MKQQGSDVNEMKLKTLIENGLESLDFEID